jgi:hypothetical protein
VTTMVGSMSPPLTRTSASSRAPVSCSARPLPVSPQSLHAGVAKRGSRSLARGVHMSLTSPSPSARASRRACMHGFGRTGAVLGVGHRATTEEVKAAFFELARLHHPDHNPRLDGEADEDRSGRSRFEQIRSAYEVRVKFLSGGPRCGSVWTERGVSWAAGRWCQLSRVLVSVEWRGVVYSCTPHFGVHGHARECALSDQRCTHICVRRVRSLRAGAPGAGDDAGSSTGQPGHSGRSCSAWAARGHRILPS